jgi:hypothetical protein
MQEKYNEFVRVTICLNKKLSIIPLLYGSLGLQQLVAEELFPEDIDILVPKEFIKEKWINLKESIESIGYHLEDLHEHEFLYGRYKIAFSFIEDLREYAKIFEEDIKTIIDKEVKYKVLDLDQYLRVYERSIKDNYRKKKNNNKDIEKIKIIKAEITKKRQLTNASTL